MDGPTRNCCDCSRQNLQNYREVVLTRYIVIFTVANLILTIAIGVLAEVLKLNSGGGLAVTAALGASFLAAAAFAKDHARPPSNEEKRSFAWRALLSTWLVSLVLSAAVLAFLIPASDARVLLRTLLSGMGLVFMLGALVVISAIYYFAIRWAFGWYAKLATTRKA